MISVRQVKAARAMLGWSQADLAKASAISYPTIARLEADDGVLGGRSDTAEKIIEALQAAGVIFVEENGDGPGVRLRKDQAALETAIKASEDALAAMDKTPSPKRALHEMKAAIAKDGRRPKGASKL